jgi:hypothetical protein
MTNNDDDRHNNNNNKKKKKKKKKNLLLGARAWLATSPPSVSRYDGILDVSQPYMPRWIVTRIALHYFT